MIAVVSLFMGAHIARAGLEDRRLERDIFHNYTRRDERGDK